MCIYVCMYVFKYVRMHAHMHDAYTYIHTYIYTYIHTYIYTYIHTSFTWVTQFGNMNNLAWPRVWYCISFACCITLLDLMSNIDIFSHKLNHLAWPMKWVVLFQKTPVPLFYTQFGMMNNLAWPIFSFGFLLKEQKLGVTLLQIQHYTSSHLRSYSHLRNMDTSD